MKGWQILRGHVIANKVNKIGDSSLGWTNNFLICWYGASRRMNNLWLEKFLFVGLIIYIQLILFGFFFFADFLHNWICLVLLGDTSKLVGDTGNMMEQFHLLYINHYITIGWAHPQPTYIYFCFAFVVGYCICSDFCT